MYGAQGGVTNIVVRFREGWYRWVSLWEGFG